MDLFASICDVLRVAIATNPALDEKLYRISFNASCLLSLLVAGVIWLVFNKISSEAELNRTEIENAQEVAKNVFLDRLEKQNVETFEQIREKISSEAKRHARAYDDLSSENEKLKTNMRANKTEIEIVKKQFENAQEAAKKFFLDRLEKQNVETFEQIREKISSEAKRHARAYDDLSSENEKLKTNMRANRTEIEIVKKQFENAQEAAKNVFLARLENGMLKQSRAIMMLEEKVENYKAKIDNMEVNHTRSSPDLQISPSPFNTRDLMGR